MISVKLLLELLSVGQQTQANTNSILPIVTVQGYTNNYGITSFAGAEYCTRKCTSLLAFAIARMLPSTAIPFVPTSQSFTPTVYVGLARIFFQKTPRLSHSETPRRKVATRQLNLLSFAAAQFHNSANMRTVLILAEFWNWSSEDRNEYSHEMSILSRSVMRTGMSILARSAMRTGMSILNLSAFTR